jgi:LmbE family N-acetylglucosaminyl deacetylase
MPSMKRYRIVLAAFLTTVLSLSVVQPGAHAGKTNAAAALQIDPIELHQALVDLGNPWTVMCVAAHPDDEDGTSLTVLRHKYGVHTVSLFSTYGEGGQNAVGPELEEELGVIRARETMAAAKVQGSEPYFLGLKDFGFSKSADEAFRFWGHDEALRRMVLKIRELRPDVIITNHDTTSGHGHHQATGRLVIEAFDAAADPKRFPEQLKDDVQTWQVKRLFVRGGFGNNANNAQTPQTGMVTIDPNDRDAARGTTYAEQALQALQKHETQGPWPKSIAEMARFRNSPDGRMPLTRYRLTLSAKDTPALPPTPVTFLDGLTLADTVAARLAPPTIDGHSLVEAETDQARVINALIAGRKSGVFSYADATEAHRFRLLNQRLDHALALLSGVALTISADATVLVPNTPAVFTVTLANGGTRATTVTKLGLIAWGNERQLQTADQLPGGTETTKTVETSTPKDAPVSVPSASHLYDGHLFGEHFTAKATIEIDGARFSINTDSRLDVAPAVEIHRVTPAPFVWTPGTVNRSLSFKVLATNHLARPFNGIMSIGTTDSRKIEAGTKFSLAPQETREVSLESSALPADLGKGRGRAAETATAVLVSVRRSDADDVVTTNSIQVVHIDARVAHDLKVGFVPSFDQTIELSLASLGVSGTKLSVDDIKTGDLKPYDTIIIDNRGYQAHPELIAANERLLSYAREGGTLIVFYHKNNEWNPDAARNRPQLAPYAITLGNERVTEENAPVTFLQPAHPLLSVPNRIGPADFVGWIQERGLYYPRDWDAHYTALLAMNDTGEAPLKGGLLVADYGRGHYIYTSMVWYRQLRAGVPGGYRVFANMISYGHK